MGQRICVECGRPSGRPIFVRRRFLRLPPEGFRGVLQNRRTHPQNLLHNQTHAATPGNVIRRMHVKILEKPALARCINGAQPPNLAPT